MSTRQGLNHKYVRGILIPLVLRSDSVHLHHVLSGFLLRPPSLLSQIIAEECGTHLRPELIILIDEAVVIVLLIVMLPALLGCSDFHGWLVVGTEDRSFHDGLTFLLYLCR